MEVASGIPSAVTSLHEELSSLATLMVNEGKW